jgi:pimeloyl-ACP methyl ester carboxylesterase
MPLRVTLGFVCCLLLATAGRGAEDRYFDSNGFKIHYQIEGKGEPVLLIHGFAVNIPAQWGIPGVIKALAQDYQVIAFDNRGHGRSDKPHDPKQYGMEMVEDVVRLLDHLKIPKAHIVGYSMGGAIALKLVATHPERCLSATLGGMGLLRPGKEAFLDELADALDQGKGITPLLVWLTPRKLPKPSESQLKLMNSLLMAGNDAKALAAVVRGTNQPSLALDEGRLKNIAVPMLAIIGSLDPFKGGVDELKRLAPQLDVVVIRGADHLTTFLDPTFIPTIKKFLARHAMPAKDSALQRVPISK